MPIEAGKLVWMDGREVSWDSASVHVLTQSLHYGWGVFEGIRAYETPGGTALFRLREHIDRLLHSAAAFPPLNEVPYDAAALCRAVTDLVRHSVRDGGCYVRPIIFLGYGEMGLNPLAGSPTAAIAAWPWGSYLGEGAENGVDVGVSSWRRPARSSYPTGVKGTGQYVNGALAKSQAVRDGYAEALMMNADGWVTEGTGENVFVVKNGTVVTPPLSDGPLAGITRDTVLRICGDRGLPVVEDHLRPEDLWGADEAFLTGTAAEITPIRSVDRKALPAARPVTDALRAEYSAIVRGRNDHYRQWLTYV